MSKFGPRVPVDCLGWWRWLSCVFPLLFCRASNAPKPHAGAPPDVDARGIWPPARIGVSNTSRPELPQSREERPGRGVVVSRLPTHVSPGSPTRCAPNVARGSLRNTGSICGYCVLRREFIYKNPAPSIKRRGKRPTNNARRGRKRR